MAESSPVFWIGDNVHEILQQTLRKRGWTEVTAGESPSIKPTNWTLNWKHSRFTASEYNSCSQSQILNHFPKTSLVTKKDSLARNLRRMRNVYGRIYDFTPSTYILPREKQALLQDHYSTNSPNEPNIWIVKPTGSSRGRGIFLISHKSMNLINDTTCIVQRYIHRPLLLSGYKFDLRLYVAVLSFRPLTVYLYDKGLARFATEKYSIELETLENLYSHLTNASVNKYNPSFSYSKEGIGTGSKLTLQQVMHQLAAAGLNTALIWKKIETMVVLTLLSIAHEVPVNRNCFEVFGFDVMLDSKGSPWLLEVNASPALGVSCSEDETVKVPMLNDLMDLLGFMEGKPWNPGFSSSRDSSWAIPRPRQGGFQLIFPCDQLSMEASKRHAAKIGQGHIAYEEQSYQKICVSALRRCGRLVSTKQQLAPV